MYVLRRILYAVPIAFGVTLLVFLFIHIAPGNPIDAVAGADASQETVDRLNAEYGFDRPLPVQYALWAGKVLQGDFGFSVATGRAVAPELLVAIGNTLILGVAACLFGFTVALILGVLAGYHVRHGIDRTVSGVAIAGVSVPHYWLGMVLIIVFAVESPLLPAGGMGPGGSEGWEWDLAHLRHLILPTITLSVIPIGIITRTVRANVAELLNQDFVQTLRAKGLKRRSVLMHVLKNATPLALAVMGLQLGHLLGGSILVETVFSWPGAGSLLHDAIFRRDLPMLQATILVLAMIFVAINLLVDICQMAIDPRMQRA